MPPWHDQALKVLARVGGPEQGLAIGIDEDLTRRYLDTMRRREENDISTPYNNTCIVLYV